MVNTAHSKLVPRLSEQWLRNMNNLIPPRLESPTARAYKLALAALTRVFGPEWRDNNILQARSGYLRNVTGANTPLERETHFMRIILLAEMIWNLQDVYGFDACISQMSDGNQIESVYAELEIARLLFTLSQATFEFRKPISAKGSDYDLKITYPDGVVACADTKCKIEETEITLNTIKGSFETARKQMPPDEPAIVFVKIPRFWLDDSEFAFAMADLARNFFRTTQRIVSIKYYTASIRFESAPHGETTAEAIAYQEHSNPRHRFDLLKDWNLFPDEPPKSPPGRVSFNGMPPHWRRLWDLSGWVPRLFV
jgi:hypothetical protein